MLQAVLGVDAARIASAFLVSPAAMSQRLVRAKTKIRDGAIPFRVPEPPEWHERVAFVLDAIYSAYTTGLGEPDGCQFNAPRPCVRRHRHWANVGSIDALRTLSARLACAHAPL